MADDRLPCSRSASIAPTNSDKVISRWSATCLRAFQNASSRLTLVLWPAMTTERLVIDLMAVFRRRHAGNTMRASCDTQLCCSDQQQTDAELEKIDSPQNNTVAE